MWISIGYAILCMSALWTNPIHRLAERKSFIMQKDLHAPDVALRDRTEEHAAHFFAAAQSPEIKAVLPMKAQTLAEALADFRKTQEPGATSFGQTIYLNGQYVGDIWCYCMDPDGDPQAMLSYCVFASSARGKGVATRAAALFLQLIAQRFGIRRVGAFTYLFNTASIRVLEKNGFLLAETEDSSGYYVRE